MRRGDAFEYGLAAILLPIAVLHETGLGKSFGNFISGCVAGAVTATATVGSGIVYGYNDAKGNNLPGREYVMPALAVSSFYSGSKLGFDDEKTKFGLTGVGINAALGAASYGVGYYFGGQ